MTRRRNKPLLPRGPEAQGAEAPLRPHGEAADSGGAAASAALPQGRHRGYTHTRTNVHIITVV